MEKVGPHVEGSGTKGHGFLDVGEFLHGGGAVSPTLQIRYVGDVSTHQEETMQISPTGGTKTDVAAAAMSGGQDLGLPTIGDGNVGDGIGGGGDVCHLLPEHSCVVIY